MPRYTGTGFNTMVHPLLQSKLIASFPSLCTIQTPNTTTEGSGQRTPTGSGTNVSGLTDIPCRIAAFAEEAQPRDTEKRGATTETDVMRIAYLSNYYPTIQPRTHLALIDTVLYKIRGAESDSEQAFTRLSLEILKPSW